MNEINLYKKTKSKKTIFSSFYGYWKTTIGRILSSKPNLPFFDSDKEIELSLGCSIKEYFDIHGEDEFRLIEKIIIDKINNYKNNDFIMSLGGGAYLNNDVRQIINYIGTSIWLNASIDIIYKRLKI